MSLCNLCSFNWERATLIESEVSLHVVMTSFVQLTRTFPESIKMLTESLFSISQPPPINIHTWPNHDPKNKESKFKLGKRMEFKCRNYKEHFWRTYSTRWVATKSRTNRKTTNSSRPYSFHLKPPTTTATTKSERQKTKKQKTEKTVTQTLNRCEHLPFFGGLVAILNGLCSLTAAGSAIVTAYICCSRSCCCRCCSNNIKYTYTYNLPWAAPRWEVVQGLWRPKQANELRVLDEPTNQKKGQDVLISMYTYTCMHCVCRRRYLCMC